MEAANDNKPYFVNFPQNFLGSSTKCPKDQIRPNTDHVSAENFQSRFIIQNTTRLFNSSSKSTNSIKKSSHSIVDDRPSESEHKIAAELTKIDRPSAFLEGTAFPHFDRSFSPTARVNPQKIFENSLRKLSHGLESFGRSGKSRSETFSTAATWTSSFS